VGIRNIFLHFFYLHKDSLQQKPPSLFFYLLFIFANTGDNAGISKVIIIFEPFFSTKPRGTGLGLATAKIIIEKHGGSINLESEYGKGAAVIIRLPIAAAIAKAIGGAA
jgi:signal transduction histidine kinase